MAGVQQEPAPVSDITGGTGEPVQLVNPCSGASGEPTSPPTLRPLQLSAQLPAQFSAQLPAQPAAQPSALREVFIPADPVSVQLSSVPAGGSEERLQPSSIPAQGSEGFLQPSSLPAGRSEG